MENFINGIHSSREIFKSDQSTIRKNKKYRYFNVLTIIPSTFMQVPWAASLRERHGVPDSLRRQVW